ncbi:MAG: C-terminal binding protein [Pseudomonadota bacterium]|nr:C-terminal binding protein [Pseudomonadota bacterium]
MKFLITDFDFPDAHLELELLREAGMDVATAQCRTEDDVIEAAKGCDGVLAQYAPMNAKVFAARPELRIVSRLGAGYDTVNVADARRFGVWVANSPDYGVGEVATHALGLALSLVRHLAWFDRDIRSGKWHYASTGGLARASEMTLGILGLGRIGKRMSYVSRNVFGPVIACDPYLIDGDFPAYVERVSKEELFRKADIVSLHVPLSDETRGLVDARLLSLMRKGSYLVNTSRGAVVAVDDVLAAVDSGRLDGAALDVLPKEPPEADHPILRHPRVLLTPHAAFYSVEGERELRRKAAQNLVDWATTGRPRYVVVEGKSR